MRARRRSYSGNCAVRFGVLPEDVTARLNTADAETLLRWSERVLSVPTLDAVFAE